MHLFFLLYLLHSITLAIRLVAYANFKTQKKRAESSRLSSRPSRLHEKMQKGIEKSPTEIKRFVIFFFQSDWDHVTPKRTCQHAITSVFPPHITPAIRYSCVFQSAPFAVIGFGSSKGIRLRGSVRTMVTALTCPDTDPNAGNVCSCASQ